MAKHSRYGLVKILALSASNRGGLALIETAEHGTFWVRAYRVRHPQRTRRYNSPSATTLVVWHSQAGDT